MNLAAPNAVIAVLLFLGLTPAASQAAPQSHALVTVAGVPDVDSRALALLEQVQARMISLRSLSAVSRETITHIDTAPTPKARSLVKTTRLRLLRPNRTRADVVWLSRSARPQPSPQTLVETFAADGRTTWRVRHGTNELTTWPTDRSGSDSEKYLPGPLRGFFDRVLLPTAFLRTLEQEHLIRRLRYLGRRLWAGVPCQVVRLQYQKAGQSVVEADDYYIGRDRMIHRLACAWPGVRVQADLTELRIDPPMTPSSFAYAPPSNAKVRIIASSQPGNAAVIGTPAPDFTLVAANGSKVHLADFKGKVVVLDFWATWCGNCIQEFPGEIALAKKYAGQGVEVLAVDVCDAPDVYRRWLARHPEDKALLFVLDPQGINGKGINTTLYKGSSLPAQYIIDRGGALAGMIYGYDGDAKETALEAAIRKACGSRDR